MDFLKSHINSNDENLIKQVSDETLGKIGFNEKELKRRLDKKKLLIQDMGGEISDSLDTITKQEYYIALIKHYYYKMYIHNNKCLPRGNNVGMMLYIINNNLSMGDTVQNNFTSGIITSFHATGHISINSNSGKNGVLFNPLSITQIVKNYEVTTDEIKVKITNTTNDNNSTIDDLKEFIHRYGIFDEMDFLSLFITNLDCCGLFGSTKDSIKCIKKYCYSSKNILGEVPKWQQKSTSNINFLKLIFPLLYKKTLEEASIIILENNFSHYENKTQIKKDSTSIGPIILCYKILVMVFKLKSEHIPYNMNTVEYSDMFNYWKRIVGKNKN